MGKRPQDFSHNIGMWSQSLSPPTMDVEINAYQLPIRFFKRARLQQLITVPISKLLD